jgi:methanogenic corrinoid protein MtbC1
VPFDNHLTPMLEAAAVVDVAAMEESLDRGFATGSFEMVVETWLLPALVALGARWEHGDVDVAAEHAISHAVVRRLAAAFQAAGHNMLGQAVVVGLPAGAWHEIGALAFATMLRRRGMNVLYLGADVPVSSWSVAADFHGATAVVLGVTTAEDLSSARATAELLTSRHPELLVAAGGHAAAELAPPVVRLSGATAAGVRELQERLHRSTSDR